MTNRQPIEINLKEKVKEPATYKMLCDFMTTALLDESEDRRRAVAKTLVGILGQQEIWIKRGDSVDNQFFLIGEYLDVPVNIYVCDKPKEYFGKPAVAKNFDIANF